MSVNVNICPGLKVGVQWMATGPRGSKLLAGRGTTQMRDRKSAVASFLPAQCETMMDRSSSNNSLDIIYFNNKIMM